MFVAGIMAEGAPDPLTYLNARLKDWGFSLGSGGQVLGSDGAERDIRYELLEPAAFADRPWHATSHPCPFVGPLAAYLRWEPESWLNHDDFRELALALLREGLGVTARLEDDRAAQAVALRRFDLDSAFGKYGIHDGDALLTHDEGPYQDYVLAEVMRVLAEAGLVAHLSWASTCHNPLRLSAVQPAGSKRLYPALWRRQGDALSLVNPDSALGDLSVELWTYDFKVLDDADFWALY